MFNLSPSLLNFALMESKTFFLVNKIFLEVHSKTVIQLNKQLK